MLLQIKASLNHGEWLPWLNGEIESGRLEVKSTQARVYMRVASNKQRGVYLEETPSIRAALELLSDKEPEEQQGSLIDAEAERQARVAAEAKAAEEREARERFEQRARESQADSPHGVFIQPGNEEAQRSNHAGLFNFDHRLASRAGPSTTGGCLLTF